MRNSLILSAVVVFSPGVLPAQPVHVAVYAGPGADPTYVAAVERALAAQADLVPGRVYPADVQAGVLWSRDVVVFPGGGADSQAYALGTAGRDQVRQFLRAGGGYAGFCAGAYLVTTDSSANLRILDAKLVDVAHWWRGVGTVSIALSSFGRQLFGVSGTTYGIRYVNGPLLAPAGDPGLPDYTTVAAFASEIAQNGAPTGVMIGTTAQAAAPYGNGRVFVTSPHPELTPGLEGWVPHAARYVSRRLLPGSPAPLRAVATVNVRSGPGMGYAVIGAVPAGQVYAGTRRSGGFWQIAFNGKTGWTHAGYYAPAPGTPAVRINTDILNVRAGPGTGYAILGTVAAGQHYALAGALVNGWYPTMWAGRTGWVYGGYVLRTTL